jgi:hypothetical protein
MIFKAYVPGIIKTPCFRNPEGYISNAGNKDNVQGKRRREGKRELTSIQHQICGNLFICIPHLLFLINHEK